MFFCLEKPGVVVAVPEHPVVSGRYLLGDYSVLTENQRRHTASSANKQANKKTSFMNKQFAKN